MKRTHAIAAALVSVAFNAAIVASLAYLGELDIPDDRHAPHIVRPSVVEPPTPQPAASSRTPEATPQRSEPSLPPAVELPPLAIPPLAREGLALAPSDQEAPDGAFDRGLDALAFAAAADGADLPSHPPQIVLTPDLSRYYPRNATQEGVDGKTIIRVEVDARGRVDQVEVLRSEPPGIFESAARAAGRAFRFEPARVRGRPVRGRTRVELIWSRS